MNEVSNFAQTPHDSCLEASLRSCKLPGAPNQSVCCHRSVCQDGSEVYVHAQARTPANSAQAIATACPDAIVPTASNTSKPAASAASPVLNHARLTARSCNGGLCNRQDPPGFPSELPSDPSPATATPQQGCHALNVHATKGHSPVSSVLMPWSQSNAMQSNHAWRCNHVAAAICSVKSGFVDLGPSNAQHSMSHVDAVPVLHARRDFESPIDPFPNQELDAEDNQDLPADPPANGPADALFLRDMLNGFHEIGVDARDDDFTAPIRSWFLDHATIRQWFAPRLFQLHGPPQMWEDQIVAVWRDQLDDNEWFDVSIVRPQPPRPPQHGAVMLDIIISQSIHFPRHAGLVTVLPSRNMQFEMYSVAVSLNQQASGEDILYLADARPLCRRRDCTITNRWQEIPISDRPVHVMQAGDSFQVLVHPNPDSIPAQKKRRGSYNQTLQASPSSSSTGVLDVPMFPADSEVGQSGAASSSSAIAPPQEDAPECACDFLHDADIHGHQTILHVFQLDGPTHVIGLHHAHGIHPSHVVAQAIGVPLTQLEILHQVPIRPADVPRGHTAVIAHRSGDIEFNQNHRLILIDINYHHHPTTFGHMTRPTQVRLVQAAREHILRDGLLFQAAVLHYCEFPPHECILQLDGHIWPEEDQAPRRLFHGSYAIVDVSPPQSPNLDTQTAAQELHRDALRPEEDVFHDLFVMSPDDDTTALMQSATLKSAIEHPPSSTVSHQSPVHVNHAISAPVTHNVPLPNSEVHGDPAADHSKIEPREASANMLHHRQCLSQTELPSLCTDTDVSPCHAARPMPELVIAKFNSSQFHPPPVHETAEQREVPLSSKAVLNPLPAGQSKITNFFTARPKEVLKRKVDPQEPTQLRLESFFTTTKPQNRTASPKPPAVAGNIPAAQVPTQALTEAKCDTGHVVDAPHFAVPIPALLMPILPPERGHHLWRLDLQGRFEELAAVERHYEGPILYVQVWFVHHGNFRTCPAPKIVRIEDDPAHWYETLIEAWRERIQFQTPVRVEIVSPPPAYTFHEHAPVHIILEQQGAENVAAIIFTAAFHGGHRMGLFQVAESVPSRVCTRLLIHHHQFQRFCDFRPCRMFSGRFQFEMDLPEEIPTGISVLLDVGNAFAPSASSTDRVHRTEEHDEIGMMQMPAPPGAPAGAPSMPPTVSPRYKAAPKSLTRGRPPQTLGPIPERAVPVVSPSLYPTCKSSRTPFNG